MGAATEAVLFDLDDTLFDRERAQREAIRLIIEELPQLLSGLDETAVVDAFLESDRLTTEAFDTLGMSEGFRDRRSALFLDMLGLDRSHAPEITEPYVALYPTVDAPIEGARPVVEMVAQERQVGIVSNGLPDVQYRKLEGLGIRHLCACIVI